MCVKFYYIISMQSGVTVSPLPSLSCVMFVPCFVPCAGELFWLNDKINRIRRTLPSDSPITPDFCGHLHLKQDCARMSWTLRTASDESRTTITRWEHFSICGLHLKINMKFAQIMLKNSSKLNIPKQVDRFSKYSPSPLSMKQFIDFGKLFTCLKWI